MIKNIRFRQAIFKDNKFDHWHYWGFIGYRKEFIGPITISGIGNVYEVKPSQEFINLYDKSNKKIYEGDIIGLSLSSDAPYAVIEWGGHWDYTAFGLSGKRKSQFEGQPDWFWDVLSPRWQKDNRIIGNIYENPDLLEKIYETT